MKFFNFVLRNQRTLLGRWEHNISEIQKNRKFDLANIDHCGDKICGTPNTPPYTNSFTSKYLVNTNDRSQIRRNIHRKNY